jgi:hypothetical protein
MALGGIVVALLGLGVALAMPAAASTPVAPSSIVATHLRIIDHQGYLGVQLRIAASDPVASFRVHSAFSDVGPNGPYHRGSWVAQPVVTFVAQHIACQGSNSGGNLDYTCQSIVAGQNLPPGSYQLDLLARRIGALTVYSGQVWMTRPTGQEQFEDVFQVVSKPAADDSTAETTRLDSTGGSGELAITLVIAANDPVYAVDAGLPETVNVRRPWAVGSSPAGSFPHQIACSQFINPQILRCARPDGTAFPPGTYTVRVPVVRHGDLIAITTPALSGGLYFDRRGPFFTPEDAYPVT